MKDAYKWPFWIVLFALIFFMVFLITATTARAQSWRVVQWPDTVYRDNCDTYWHYVHIGDTIPACSTIKEITPSHIHRTIYARIDSTETYGPDSIISDTVAADTSWTVYAANVLSLSEVWCTWQDTVQLIGIDTAYSLPWRYWGENIGTARKTTFQVEVVSAGDSARAVASYMLSQTQHWNRVWRAATAATYSTTLGGVSECKDSLSTAGLRSQVLCTYATLASGARFRARGFVNADTTITNDTISVRIYVITDE